MNNSYFISSNNGENYMEYSYASACKEARKLSKKYGKAEILTEEPYWYKGYRFWIRSEKNIFIDGEFSHKEDVNVLFGAISGTYLPLEEWKKEQDKWFYENMKKEWLESNYGE